MHDREADMKRTGGCLCGSVRYEASGTLGESSGYCHCRMCQRAYGGAFAVFAIFPEENLRFTSGQPKTYKSSEMGRRSFCADCGTPLIMTYVGTPGVGILVGSLDHPEDCAPKCHSGIESHMPWLTIDDRLPRWRTEDDPDMAAAQTAAERSKG